MMVKLGDSHHNLNTTNTPAGIKGKAFLSGQAHLVNTKNNFNPSKK
jgi:hypothetical protein